MTVAMQLNPVAGGDDLGRQGGAADDLLAGEEKRCSRIRLPQALQRERGALRMGTVVKGQRYAVGVLLSPQDPEPGRQTRDNRRNGVDQGSSVEAGRTSCTAAEVGSSSLPMWMRSCSGLATTL